MNFSKNFKLAELGNTTTSQSRDPLAVIQMKTVRIVPFLVIYVAITFFWLLYDRRKVFDRFTIYELLKLPAIWIFPILMAITGLFLSGVYSKFEKAKSNNFIFGQLTCLLITFLLFIYTFISDWQHEKRFGNFESNRANRDNTFFLADTSYQIKAYDALESNFPDKNSFRVIDLFSDKIDTVINSTPAKIHISWFEYYLSNNPQKLLCAKYYIFNDTLVSEYINSDAARNSDFQKRKAYKDSLLKLVDGVSN